MRLKNYIHEAAKLQGTMIGYLLDEKSLQSLRRYMRSWFERYDIEYKEPDHMHISIAQIIGKHPKDEMARVMNALPGRVTFRPKKINVFEGVNFPRHFFVLEYAANQKFLDAYTMLNDAFEIKKFPSGPRPHLSLFHIAKDSMNPTDISAMITSAPKLPKLKSTKIGLWNKKFELDFSRKI